MYIYIYYIYIYILDWIGNRMESHSKTRGRGTNVQAEMAYGAASPVPAWNRGITMHRRGRHG